MARVTEPRLEQVLEFCAEQPVERVFLEDVARRGLGRFVALKMIAHQSSRVADLFQIEAKAVAQLQHPNIVQIFEIGQHEGQPFLALEFVGGEALDRRIAGRPQPPRMAAETVRTLALAVDYAHQRENRPALGSLTGFRAGRAVPPRPDGSMDLTTHVAIDAVAAAGLAAGVTSSTLTRQSEALRALGVTRAELLVDRDVAAGAR